MNAWPRTISKIREHYTLFTFIVFQAMTAKENGGGEKGIIAAQQTFKSMNKAATAVFGGRII